MKAVLALIVIYVGTFLVAIQGSSSTSVGASEQTAAQGNPPINPVKEKDIRSLLELVGARDTIQESASAATEQYRQKVTETSANTDRMQAFSNAYVAELQKQLDADAMTGQLVGIYDKHFTDDEIRGLLEFYGSPLGQKAATEFPKISREVQLATRTASSQAARLAWQNLRSEYSGAGGTSRSLPARRRTFGGNGQAQSQAQSSATQQTQADSSQP